MEMSVNRPLPNKIGTRIRYLHLYIRTNERGTDVGSYSHSSLFIFLLKSGVLMVVEI